MRSGLTHRTALAGALALALWGCSDDGAFRALDGAPPPDAARATDGAPPDIAVVADGAVDSGADAPTPVVDDVGAPCASDADCDDSCLKIAGQTGGLCTVRGCVAGGCPAGSVCEGRPGGTTVEHVCVKTCQSSADCPQQSGGFGCVGAAGGEAGRCYGGLAGWLDLGGPDDCLTEAGRVGTTGFIVVRKRFRRLSLCGATGWLGSWPVGLGQSPVGPKEKQGDSRTPEGLYYVAQKKSSSYYMALLVSYPNAADAQKGLAAGLITQTQHDAIVSAVQTKSTPPQSTPLGGMIEIHGCPAGYTVCSNQDWTAGCVAVDNAVMDVLWKACSEGDDIVLAP
jgi:hypothetical protein